MIGAMARCTVPVPPAIVPREDFIERIKEVDITTGPGFHDGQTGRRMRNEHGQKPIASPIGKLSCVRRDIHHLPLMAGVDRDDRCVHARQTTLKTKGTGPSCRPQVA